MRRSRVLLKKLWRDWRRGDVGTFEIVMTVTCFYLIGKELLYMAWSLLLAFYYLLT